MKRFVWFCGFAGKLVFAMLFDMYATYRMESMREKMIPSPAADTVEDDKDVNKKRHEEYLSAYV